MIRLRQIPAVQVLTSELEKSRMSTVSRTYHDFALLIALVLCIVCTMPGLARTAGAGEVPERGIQMSIRVEELSDNRATGFYVVLEIRNGTSEPVAVFPWMHVTFEHQADPSIPFLGDRERSMVDKADGQYRYLTLTVRGRGDGFQAGFGSVPLCDRAKRGGCVTIGPGETSSLGTYVQHQLKCVLVGAEASADLTKGVDTICRSNKVTIRALRGDSREQNEALERGSESVSGPSPPVALALKRTEPSEGEPAGRQVDGQKGRRTWAYSALGFAGAAALGGAGIWLLLRRRAAS